MRYRAGMAAGLRAARAGVRSFPLITRYRADRREVCAGRERWRHVTPQACYSAQSTARAAQTVTFSASRWIARPADRPAFRANRRLPVLYTLGSILPGCPSAGEQVLCLTTLNAPS